MFVVLSFSMLGPHCMLLLIENTVVGRGDILGPLVKSPLFSLSRRQDDKVFILLESITNVSALLLCISLRRKILSVTYL